MAHVESETREARNDYTYRQSVTVEELNDRGARSGEYREVRDIVFSPQHERSEQIVSGPANTLKHLVLTREDFEDIRQIQPFIMTEDQLWNYETKFRGEEDIDGVDCWVLQIRPRQILSGQRLFDGMLWIDKKTYAIVRAEGQAVPQIRSMKSENLFPRFTTTRAQVDGHNWFPVKTHADDTLWFRTGPVRMRLIVRYSNYQRFKSDSRILYGHP